MSHRKNKLKIAAGLFAGFVLFLAVLYLVMIAVSDSKIRSQMASGKILTLDDLAKESVPDSENGALIYSQAFQLMASPGVYNDTTLLTNHFINESERKAQPELWGTARKLQGITSGIISLIEQATDRPKCRFPVNYRAGAAALFPHMPRMREASRILHANAILAAHDGDMDRAAYLVELNFKLAKSLEDEPIIISNLVMIAITKIASESQRQVMQYGDIGEEQAKRVSDAAGSIDLTRASVRGMEGERAFGLGILDQLRRQPGTIGNVFAGPTITNPVLNTAIVNKLFGYAWIPVAHLDQSIFLTMMQKNIEACKYTHREAKAKGLISDPNQVPSYAIFTRLMCPVFTQVSISRDCATAEIRGSRLSLALGIYRKKFGSYPVKLAELKKLPEWKLQFADPLSGKDFIYRRKGEGFVLYSVGQNMKDDGGKAPKPTSSQHRSLNAPVDIVWEMKR